MLRKVVVMLVLVLCGLGEASARVPETPRFRFVGPEQGLPSTALIALARDREGYLWIGTADGLARWDGLSMRVWRHEENDPASLPANNVQAIHVDARDRVWVAIESGGLHMLDARRMGFRHYVRAEHPEMTTDDVLSITSKGDDVWFGSYNGGLYRLDTRNGHITHFAHAADDPDSAPETVLDLAFDAAGDLWVGGFPGFARFDGHRLHRERLPGVDEPVYIHSFARDGETLVAGDASGVYRRGRDGRWTKPGWSPMFQVPNTLNRYVRDRAGTLWLGGNRELWRLPGTGTVPEPVPLGGPGVKNPVTALLLQDDGAMWVHVGGAGLGYLRSDWRRFATFTRADNGLLGDSYAAVAPARDGGVWLGSFNGEVERIGGDGAIERLGDAQRERLKDLRIYSIAEDPAGRLWIGYRPGLIRVDTDGTVDDWTDKSAKDATLPIWIDLIRIARDGTVWTSSQGGGIQQRDPDSGRVLRQFAIDPPSGVGNGETEAMEFAPDGSPWIATAEGLRRLNTARTAFEAVPGLPREHVFAFAFDGAGVVWLQGLSGMARYEGGADRWRPTQRVGIAEGLPSVAAAGLRVDRTHQVWLSSSRGLFRWNPATRIMRRYGVQSGLGSQEFIERSLTLTTDGVLAMGAADGSVALVDTAMSDPPARKPNLVLDSFAVRRDGRWQSERMDRTIRMPPDDHEFRIRMRLLAFDDPLGNRYWSRLDGFDGGWVAQGALAERSFTGLPPGRYLLHVRAADAAGVASDVRQLAFVILPSWWETAWARIAFALVALALLAWLAAGYRARLKRRTAWQLAKQKRALAEQASEAKTRFLATLGHEVRTPMTGVLGMSELLLATGLDDRQRRYAESIHRAGDHLMRLVNDALDLARIEAGKLDLDAQPVDLHALLDEVGALSGPLARQRGLDYAESIDPDVPRWVHADPVRLRQILLNLLGNAIKFTERGGVSLRIEAAAPGIRMIVGDTGPGLDEAQRARLFRRFEQAEGARTAARYGGSGLGLAICQELAIAMDGRIDVDSVPGQGTRFTVELPLTAIDAPGSLPAPSGDGPALTCVDCDILLVEDDPTVAQVIAELLRAQGHRVVHAAHGLAALSEVASARFDLALLDLDLPGIDGLALARQLRAQGFERPLIAVTARTDADVEPRARAAGFDAFLRKPVTGELLASTIAQVTAPDP